MRWWLSLILGGNGVGFFALTAGCFCLWVYDFGSLGSLALWFFGLSLIC
ncbi:hypothetical protein GGD70_003298 [Paraburkholderia fungorum]|nr:hypothetical protein [Paraburkholderia fungorum]